MMNFNNEYNELKEKINDYFDKCQNEIISDICSLIGIKSTREAATPEAPFGEGVAAALAAALRIAEKLGYKTINEKNYFGIADFIPDGSADEPALAILAHLDVVPEGSGWSSDPYRAELRDGKIFGRGSADDKGPAVAALYAVKAASDIAAAIAAGNGGTASNARIACGLKKPVRVILGCCEETGSEDLDHYYRHYKMPEMTFSPDADFPLINIEKGRFALLFHRKFPVSKGQSALDCNLVILEFRGGDTQNIVPQEASCRIMFKNNYAEEVIKSSTKKAAFYTNALFTVEKGTGEDDIYIIKSIGTGAHAATPESGNNAQTALLCMLVDLYNKHKADICADSKCDECSSCDDDNFFHYAATLLRLFPHGQTDGTNLNVAFTDSKSGALTLNFGVMNYKDNLLSCGIDMRIPICDDYDAVLKAVKDNLSYNGFTIDNSTCTKPHCTDENSEFVQTLLRSYSDITGNKAECISIGGGTYVHDIPGGVAFGCAMPGTDNRMHGSNEFCVIEEIIQSAKIFTLAIMRLCG